jgi:hypothetical protein
MAQWCDLPNLSSPNPPPANWFSLTAQSRPSSPPPPPPPPRNIYVSGADREPPRRHTTSSSPSYSGSSYSHGGSGGHSGGLEELEGVSGALQLIFWYSILVALGTLICVGVCGGSLLYLVTSHFGDVNVRKVFTFTFYLSCATAPIAYVCVWRCTQVTFEDVCDTGILLAKGVGMIVALAVLFYCGGRLAYPFFGTHDPNPVDDAGITYKANQPPAAKPPVSPQQRPSKHETKATAAPQPSGKQQKAPTEVVASTTNDPTQEDITPEDSAGNETPNSDVERQSRTIYRDQMYNSPELVAPTTTNASTAWSRDEGRRDYYRLEWGNTLPDRRARWIASVPSFSGGRRGRR